MNNVNNLGNLHLTEEEIKNANEALTNLETALEKVDVNLTPSERVFYGSINEKNKLLVNKVHDYALLQPELMDTEMDVEEFLRDYKSRGVYEGLINRLESLLDRLINAKILHDYDNYRGVLNDYKYTTFRAKSNTAGFEQKHRELKQFFVKYRNKRASTGTGSSNKKRRK